MKSLSKQLPLLKAIEDFNDRIIPHFTTVEKQKRDIDTLRKELHRSNRERDGMQTKLRRAELLQTEVVSLREALAESEANTQEAIRLAEVAKDDLGKTHETSGQWQRRAVELDQENKRFKDMLERHASVVGLPLKFVCVDSVHVTLALYAGSIAKREES